MKAYSYDLRLRVLRAVDQGRSRAEIVAMFAVSLATLKRYLKRQRETGDVRTKPIPGRPAKKGAAWREQAQALDAGKLVFIDECGSNIALTRLYARSPKGKRAYGAIPRNRRANITLLASLSQKANGRGAHLGGVCGCSRF